MFELLNPTKAKLLDVVVLSQKNRQPDDNPGVKLVVQMPLTNDMLVAFDGSLRSFLFTHSGASPDPQGKLDGVPPVSDTPDLTSAGMHVGTLKWQQDMSGYTLVVDFGLGGKRNIILLDCALSQWRLTPKKGGTVVAKVNIDAPDVDEPAFGKLAKLKSREITITLRAPEVEQEDIEDEPAPPPSPARAAPAAAPAQVHADGPWPFPRDGDGAAEAPPDEVTIELPKRGRRRRQGAAA
jgi:hypothetical protein